MNTELLFQTLHSVNQLGVYGAVTNRCYQFGLTEEEKGRVGIPVDNKILTMVEPEEMELLVSPPTQAPGNRMQGSALSFKAMEKKVQATQLCQKTFFQHLVIACEFFSTRCGRRLGTVTAMCREYSSSRSYPKTQALAAPEGATIGPVLDFHIVEILDEYGIEIAIPLVADPKNSSYVVITRETERLVNEIHDHKKELRSSSELLADLQESGRSEVYEERTVTKSFKETCAGPLSLTPRKASLFTKRTIPTCEKKWKVIHAHSPDGGHLAVSVSNMLRHFDQEGRQTDGSRRWDSTKPVLMRASAHEKAQDFSDTKWLCLIHEGSTKTRLEHCKDERKKYVMSDLFRDTLVWVFQQVQN